MQEAYENSKQKPTELEKVASAQKEACKQFVLYLQKHEKANPAHSLYFFCESHEFFIGHLDKNKKPVKGWRLSWRTSDNTIFEAMYDEEGQIDDDFPLNKYFEKNIAALYFDYLKFEEVTPRNEESGFFTGFHILAQLFDDEPAIRGENPEPLLLSPVWDYYSTNYDILHAFYQN